MASSLLLLGFFLDDLTFPWGTTLAEVADRLPDRAHWPSYGAGSVLQVAGAQVLGLPVAGCSLQAPSRHRPVLQVRYELAAAPNYRGQPAETDQWLAPLRACLGAPAQAGATGRPGAAGTGQVVYAARWPAPGVQLSLAAYGAAQPAAGGPVAARLLLEWEDEVAAARPYVAAIADEEARLAAVAGPDVELRVVQLARAQEPYGHFVFGQPQPPSDERRRAQRALYRDQLLETPPYFRQQLAAAEVALWRVPGPAAWAVSTRWDTCVLPAAAPPRVELLTAQPGRGPGYRQLTIGTLRLTDDLTAPALPALADTLAQVAGAVISCREDYDGW